MKVYVVLHDWRDYDTHSDEFEGVFASETDALAFALEKANSEAHIGQYKVICCEVKQSKEK